MGEAEFKTLYNRLIERGDLYRVLYKAYKNCGLTGVGFFVMNRFRNGEIGLRHVTWTDTIYELKKLGAIEEDPKVRPNNIDHSLVFELRDQGYSIRNIADRLNVSPAGVHYALKRRGDEKIN